MRRLGILLLVLLLVAVAIIVLALRHRETTAAAGVATLLPADTALLIHIPDFETNREHWQHTDLYQLYHEPTVQEFLRKPRTQLPKGGALTTTWQDAATLRMRDGFLATNTFDAVRFTAGFEFRCGEQEARDVIERWRAWAAKNAQRSSATYNGHVIDVVAAPRLKVASVVVDHRFFAATEIDDLKALLDRVDRRRRENRLNADPDFRADMKQMPGNYAVLLYLQPKVLAQKLAALRAQSGRALPAAQQTLLERMRSFCHAMVFDGGKLRDVDFARMPRLAETKLTRDTLPAASADTLLYLAAITNIRETFSSGITNSALSAAGVTREDWKAAFGDEVSVLADWPASARMPGGVATLSVRDAARAKKIAAALASASGWEASARGDTEFFTAPATGLALMRLVAAVSDKRLAVGGDAASVQRALSPERNTNALAGTAGFRDVARMVPEPEQFFAWLDLAALYSRLDATLRPLLQISAAFMPEASNRFDVSKLPPADVVTKHLRPVVASQSYVGGGYRSESVGTITLSQAVVLGFGGYAGSMFYGKHADVLTGWKIAPAPGTTPVTPGSSPPALATASPTP